MATTTVKILAEELKKSTDNVLDQLRLIGIQKNAVTDTLTEDEKKALLDHIDKTSAPVDANGRKKITLTKRETSEIRQSDSAGRTRTVQVEVRKKRVLVKRDENPVEEVVTPVEPVNTAPKPIIDNQELAKREAEANRQAELLARQEAELQAANDAKKLKQKAAQDAELAAQQKTEKIQEPQVQQEPVQEQAPVVEKEPVKPVVEVKDTSEEDLKSIRARRAIAEAEALAIRQMMSTPSKVLKAPPPPAPPAPVADDQKEKYA